MRLGAEVEDFKAYCSCRRAGCGPVIYQKQYRISATRAGHPGPEDRRIGLQASDAVTEVRGDSSETIQ
jgi:hypothetical protein